MHCSTFLQSTKSTYLLSVDELVIEPPVYTNAGKWGPRRICKEGHFVVGMRLKIHRNRAGNEPLQSLKFHNLKEGL